MSITSTTEPADQVWEILGLKTMPVSTDWVSAVSPKLRGGLYIEAVLPGSPAAQAAIQKGDILVGMNVGTRHWETIRPTTSSTCSASLRPCRHTVRPCT